MKLAEALERVVELAKFGALEDWQGDNDDILLEQIKLQQTAINLVEDFVTNNADEIDEWFRVLEVPNNFSIKPRRRAK